MPITMPDKMKKTRNVLVTEKAKANRDTYALGVIARYLGEYMSHINTSGCKGYSETDVGQVSDCPECRQITESMNYELNA